MQTKSPSTRLAVLLAAALSVALWWTVSAAQQSDDSTTIEEQSNAEPTLEGTGSGEPESAPTDLESPQTPYCGDPTNHVFHRSGCTEPDDCSVPFPNPYQPLHEGYLPCDVCRPPMEPPTTVQGESTACRSDDDCVGHVGNCLCSPCGYRWPRVLNRERDEHLRALYAVERCAAPECAECPVEHISGGGEYLPIKTHCVDGYCTMSYW